jgi:hypothetical protein
MRFRLQCLSEVDSRTLSDRAACDSATPATNVAPVAGATVCDKPSEVPICRTGRTCRTSHRLTVCAIESRTAPTLVRAREMTELASLLLALDWLLLHVRAGGRRSQNVKRQCHVEQRSLK